MLTPVIRSLLYFIWNFVESRFRNNSPSNIGIQLTMINEKVTC